MRYLSVTVLTWATYLGVHFTEVIEENPYFVLTVSLLANLPGTVSVTAEPQRQTRTSTSSTTITSTGTWGYFNQVLHHDLTVNYKGLNEDIGHVEVIHMTDFQALPCGRHRYHQQTSCGVTYHNHLYIYLYLYTLTDYPYFVHTLGRED